MLNFENEILISGKLKVSNENACLILRVEERSNCTGGNPMDVFSCIFVLRTINACGLSEAGHIMSHRVTS